MFDLSVVVCTYNRCESLRDTLRALKQQELPEEIRLEILVVDNNSKDRTRQVVEEEARESRWPIRYVFERAQGLNYARNRGTKESQGEFVAFTDDDIIPDTRTLLHQLFMESITKCQQQADGGRSPDDTEQGEQGAQFLTAGVA